MEIQPLNGATKRRLPSPPPPAVSNYKECMKNHAAARGGHALDGCCEFMSSCGADLTCAACGCHRNFHRRELAPPAASALPPPLHFTEYTPHHRHQPPPPPPHPARSSDSRSPPPISSFYPTSAPQVLFSLGGGGNSAPPFGRKRIRTKFTQEQKEKMLGFADKIGWKMQRGIEDTVAKFCAEIGVERGVFKVWMHNHKNTSFKRDLNIEFGNNGVGANGSSSSS